MLTYVACAAWGLWGFAAGSAWGPRWQYWLFRRREELGRHAARPGRGRHAPSPPVDHGSYAEPELTGSARAVLADVVSWAQDAAGPAAIANGRHLADMIRLDEIADDLAAAGVLLHVVSFTRHVAALPDAVLGDVDPADITIVVAEAIAGAVFDLTSLHRATR